MVIPDDRVAEALGPDHAHPALSHPGRCSTPLATTPARRVDELLEQAARFRLSGKTRLLQRLEDSHGFEEALWQSIARALGYGPNKLAMHLLAQRIPRRVLRSVRTHRTREAILFGAAGFLAPDLHRKAPADSRHYLESLWHDWWRVRPRFEAAPSRVLNWQMHGTRPTNHPQRRLGALASLSVQWSRITAPAQRPSLGRMQRLAERLESLEHDFWSSHYTLHSKASRTPTNLVGSARTNEFLANYYIPSWSRSAPEEAWAAYRELPAGPASDPVRRAITRLFGNRRDHRGFHSRLWQQQALLQIYRDFCLEDSSDCEDCPFPEQLRDW